MEEDPMKVARSIVAGCLIQRYDEICMFTPIETEVMLAYLKEDYLLTSFEKEALLKLGKSKENSDETMISALNSVLVTIEKDTGGVTCYHCNNLMGRGKERIIVESIEYDRLFQELIPRPPLPFLQELAGCSEDVSKEQERERLIHEILTDSTNNWAYPTIPATSVIRTHTGSGTCIYRRRCCCNPRIQRRVPMIAMKPTKPATSRRRRRRN